MSLPCYTPWKDIVAPPMINDQSLIDSKGGSKEGHHKRNVLASFRGTILTGGTWSMYSRFIIQKWNTLYDVDDEYTLRLYIREGMGSRRRQKLCKPTAKIFEFEVLFVSSVGQPGLLVCMRHYYLGVCLWLLRTITHCPTQEH